MKHCFFSNLRTNLFSISKVLAVVTWSFLLESKGRVQLYKTCKEIKFTLIIRGK